MKRKERVLYVAYDAGDGRILGFYNSHVHKNIPSPNAVVTQEQKDAAPESNFYIDGSLVFIPDIETKEQIDSRILRSRGSAYRTESDSLFMEWQYDELESSKQKWRAKVTEIKARYPKQ